MKFYCYIIYSETLNKYYIGSTSEPVKTRLFQHNSSYYGVKKYTHKANDWEIILIIECTSRKQAESIERHIKAMKSTKFIDNLKKYPEIETKLLEKYRDS